MKLVPVRKEEKNKKIMYRSSMNPDEVSERPGKDSMGMEMIPFEVEDGMKDQAVQGLASVRLSDEKRGILGLSAVTIRSRPLMRELRTSARIAIDETRLVRVTVKVEGWVERLYVNQTGQFVKKGAPLFTIYSPELLSAQQEYLSTVKAAERYAAIADSPMAASMREVQKSARERLRLLDITDAQIEKIKASGRIERTIVLHAPASGYVIEKKVLPGQKLEMNQPLMEIADLSRVWGEADIYESDLPYVRLGMPAEISLSYWPGKLFRGRISFIAPVMDAETRTVKARIEIPNHGMLLKPQMYADARLSIALGKKMAVPEDAVMRTGTRDYVFLEGRDHLVVPIEVKLGARSGDGYFEVHSGLKAGDRVISPASFLVDSESSLKAAFRSAGAAKEHAH